MSNNCPMGFYPFWFWNDVLTADEIRWQVAQMAAQGVKGFFIHPRQGLQQPYLSASFFEMVEVAIAAAREHQLVVHLYDEYPYPSGIAGGEVVLGCPQYYATDLVQETHDVEGGRVRLTLPPGKILSCVAYPLQNGQPDWERGIDLREHVGMVLAADSYIETGLTTYNQKRYFASEPTPTLAVTLPDQPHRLFVSVQTEVHHFKYWHHFVDVLNPEAVTRFVNLTHERYYRHYGDEFGRQIISIFVDETSPTWSDGLPDAFREAYDYNLAEFLPALQDPTHPDHLRVAYDLYRLKYRLFCRSFEAPLAAWCRAHGLAYSGEKPSLRMAQLKYMDLPGCEPGHTKVGARLDIFGRHLRGNAKATASAAYFYGKTGALCECYHSTGWSATLQDAKFVAEALLLAGIKYLVPHGFFYSTHALKKHDAPPTFFFQMPFWPLFGHLSQRLERIRQLFEDTYLDAEILVVDPTSGLPTAEDLAAYESLLWLLLENHLDFHMVDTDILKEGRIEEGRVRVADIAARVVMVPPMQVVEEPLQIWLAAFEAADGKVVLARRPLELDTLKEELLSLIQPSLKLQVDGREAGEILVAKRVAGDRQFWFALNTSAESLDVQLKTNDQLAEIPLDPDGPVLLRKEGGQYLRQMAPFESLVVEAVEAGEPAPAIPRIKVRVSGPAELELENENLLRMYLWRMALLAEDGEPGPEKVVPAIPLAEQLAYGQFRFSPVFKRHFGHVPELELPELHVRYQYSFVCAYPGPVHLIMEPGSIVGKWAIYVNGYGPIKPAHLKPATAHVRGSLGVEITALLHQGENTLHVEVLTDRLDGGLLNPLYLAGDFGVTLNPVRLGPRERSGDFEQYQENLIPYFAGVIRYTTRFELAEIPAAAHVLLQFEYDGPFHEATEVSVNGSPYQPVLWQPRCVKLSAHHLVTGENILKTRVYTTLIRSFEGQWFDYQSHTYRDVELSGKAET
ncbi:MAG: hypothetical protein JXM69_09990 [Anaerolineae bacterium]|nr:hypothetical protein [Anaerolineae bacterium]